MNAIVYEVDIFLALTWLGMSLGTGIIIAMFIEWVRELIRIWRND